MSANTETQLALEPPDAAAKRLGVGKTTLYRLLKEGRLRRAKIPGVRRTGIVSADIDKLLQEAIEP